MPTNLKQARIDAGYSVAAFASKLDVGQATVRGWESGSKYPSFNRLKRICELLNEDDPFWLFEKSDRVSRLSVEDIQKLRSNQNAAYWLETLGHAIWQYNAAAILGVSSDAVRKLLKAHVLRRATSGGVNTVSVLARWIYTESKRSIK